MNLIEALKTRKKIRRLGVEAFDSAIVSCISVHTPFAETAFGDVSVFADDWEVEPEPEEKIEVTEETLRRAFYQAMPATLDNSPVHFRVMLGLLGLGDKNE